VVLINSPVAPSPVPNASCSRRSPIHLYFRLPAFAFRPHRSLRDSISSRDCADSDLLMRSAKPLS